MVDPRTYGGVLLDVDAANAEGGEEAAEQTIAGGTLHEGTEPANRVDEVLLWSGILDEGVEGRRLVDVASCVEGTVDPLLEEVEDRGDGVVVRLVALSAVTDLRAERKRIR